jgi:small subunit ribosomal protein S8
MSLQDPLADLFTRIRNAQLRKKKIVTSPLSKMRESILEVLKNEGYIRGYARTQHSSGREELDIELKYDESGPVISNITRISKPGRRVYSSVERIPFIHNGLGISILSTSQGVMSDSDAREKKIGGEIICRVF